MHRYGIALRQHKTAVRWVIVLAGLGIVGVLLWSMRPVTQVADFDSCVLAGNEIIDGDPQTCSDGSKTFAADAAPIKVSSEPVGVDQPFDILVDGDSRGTYPNRQEVISSQTEWVKYWREVHAGIKPLPPLLPVDFKTTSVVAISEGPSTTSRYRFRITSISTGEMGTIVKYREVRPGQGCTPVNQASNRYSIVKTAKLPQPVVFKADTETRPCK